jgi:hypothetical protein
MTLLTSYTPGQIEFIKFLHDNRKTITVYNDCTVSRKDLVTLLSNSPYIAVPAWIAADRTRRAGRGNYLIPEINADLAALTVNTNKRGRKPGSRNVKGTVPVTAPATTNEITA